jgi:D-alanyl-lipoteichoic acid acyltransferase DltB (MBOAT superfamily)
MLFNSFVFIFLFLPISLVGYYAISRHNTRAAAAWLVLASFVFYGWWNALFVILLVASILGNYFIGVLLRAHEQQPRTQTLILTAGIAVNLLVLFYYKYLGFLAGLLAQIGLDVHLNTGGILLPLGISFFTFTQIGYLVDCKSGIAREGRLLDYALFVTFFPHLIAGPILHHREMMPQFANKATYQFHSENLAVGLTIFIIGLAKKVLIADPLAPITNLGFANAEHLGFVASWTTALAYSMQLYFDFSGYSDMAIGLARMFGIRFPMNFNSPYKARNIIDFWQRWHMTLTRYLTLFLYNPISLAVTRRRLAAGKPVANKGAATATGFLHMIAFPTLFTMSLAGIWHGAGVNYFIFGALHGIYLTINHAWRVFKPRLRQKGHSAAPGWPAIVASILVTYLAVLIAQVFFRAHAFQDAIDLLSGMVGMHGFADIAPSLTDARAAFRLQFEILNPQNWIMLLFCFIIVFCAPNSAEMLAAYNPTLEPIRRISLRSLQWKPTATWAVSVGIMAAASVLLIFGTTEFLYFQF